MAIKLRVLVVEDDAVACKCFVSCALEMGTIEIVGCTNDSDKGLELVRECLPDAVILDLELNEGKGSGIEFLNGLNNLGLGYKPFVLVTTNNLSSTIYDYVRKSGAGFIMSKQKKDYSEKAALEFLITISDSIVCNSDNSDERQSFVQEVEENSEKALKSRIYRELDLVGISPKFLGYDYLADAIYLVMNDEKEKMLQIIGEKYKKTDASVERAMQTAINKAWRSNDIDELLEYYTARISSDKGVPTLMEFIYYYAKKLKM
ncbi:MAG: response regulator [Lachnospiraceae bacterium]|nr:response regulator [Lachnospiraceae bacterium]